MNEILSYTENEISEETVVDSVSENNEEALYENQDTSPDVEAVTPTDECDCEALEGDADELRARFPELSGIERIDELKSYKRYSELRALGLTPEEAYLATARRNAVHDNRSHITSAVPRAASSPRGMSRRELGIARELFSDLSDSEIQRLYQKVTK